MRSRFGMLRPTSVSTLFGAVCVRFRPGHAFGRPLISSLQNGSSTVSAPRGNRVVLRGLCGTIGPPCRSQGVSSMVLLRRRRDGSSGRRSGSVRSRPRRCGTARCSGCPRLPRRGASTNYSARPSAMVCRVANCNMKRTIDNICDKRHFPPSGLRQPSVMVSDKPGASMCTYARATATHAARRTHSKHRHSSLP